MSDMGALLFAGGVGQRLWPLSRRNTPKQFAPLVGDRSSFRIAFDRLARFIPPARIHVGTNARYADVLRAQVPEIPERNFTLEPARRDVAAAVALAFFGLEKDGVRGPFLFQWTDNYVKHDDRLVAAIQAGRALVDAEPQRLVFIGEKPRFANENLGWIELGDELGRRGEMPYYAFRSWHYRPPKAECERMFASGRFVWNAGFFVTTVEFMTATFRALAPELSAKIEEIVSYRGTPDARRKLEEIYPTVPALHFDEAILMRLPPGKAVLLQGDLGWSDPGSLYALKELLQTTPEATVSRGDVVEVQTKDCFLDNTHERGKKLVAAMGIEGVMVIDTPDVLLVIHKDSVRHMQTLLEELARRGHDRLL